MNTLKLYDKNHFNANLPIKPYCTNDLGWGLLIRPREQALEFKYIQSNHLMIKFMIFDLDYEDAFYAYEEKGLPTPNIISRNPVNGHCHYIYFLKTPVCKTDNGRLAPLKLFAKIQQAYTEKLSADKGFVGLITKNPNHEDWDVFSPIGKAYELEELAEYVTLPKYITKKEAVGEGRNVFLFDTVRKWAYNEVLFYKKHGANLEDFIGVILNKLEKTNTFAVPLGFNELKAIAKSIGKWTWRNFSIEKFSEIQTERSHKRKSVKNKQRIIEELR